MKKLLLTIAILIIIIAGAITALVTLVNPNQFKPLLVEQVKKQTGLDLVIQGDIHWQFFPSIGFELGKTELKNPQGFANPDMFKVNQVAVSVSVIPLLDKQLKIGNVTLKGAQIDVETLKDGTRNIDALLSKNKTDTNVEAVKPDQLGTQQTDKGSEPTSTALKEVSASASSSSSDKWSVDLEGVTIENATLQMNDKQTGSFTKLSNVSLNLSGFAANQWTKATFAADGENNQQTFSADGSLEFKLSKDFSQYELRNVSLTSSFNAPDIKIGKVHVALNTFQLDKENQLSYSVNGDASGLSFDLKGEGTLSVDHTLSTVALSNFTLDGDLQGKSLPESPMKLNVNTALSFDLEKKQLTLQLEKLKANALELDGTSDVTLTTIPKIRFDLHSPNINLDEFLKPQGTTQAESSGGTAQSSSSEQTSSKGQNTKKPVAEVEPDLSALKTIDIAGKIAIDKFQMQNAKMQNVKASISVKDGVAKLNSFTSNLYDGKISANGTLDARKSPASYKVVSKIVGVQVQPLLKDVANNGKLEGVGNIDLNLHGKGLTPSGIKQNVAGTVAINFTDGAVNGINVAQLIRTNYAKLKGQPVENSNEVQKTDFSSMKATVKLANGVATTDDLSAKSPLLRVHGQGSANYVKETVDALIRTSIVGSLKGQGGQSINELKDVTIPVKVTGPWTNLKYKVILDNALKQKAKNELEKGIDKLNKKLGDKINNEKTKQAVDKLINNLFK